MLLRAGCEMTLDVAEPSTCVAMLRPRSGDAQWVQSESFRIAPRLSAAEYVDAAGNLCQRVDLPAGTVEVRVEAVVETSDTIHVQPAAPLTPVSRLPHGVLQYLLPSRYCPADKLGDRAKEVVAQARPGYGQVAAIERFIHGQITYRYGVSDASTDAIDTLQQGAGVCRDFAHIGIALCRALRIPARMVVGYLYGLEPMDMHAWFEAYVGDRWYTFDATQPGPRGGRIVIAYGRDAVDVALISEYGPIQTQEMRVWVERAS